MIAWAIPSAISAGSAFTFGGFGISGLSERRLPFRLEAHSCVIGQHKMPRHSSRIRDVTQLRSEGRD